MRRFLVFIFFSFWVLTASAQFAGKFSIGFNYGFGSEFKNKDYTFENNFCKLQIYYTLKENKNINYQILVQPEINFAKHKLLNLYFVKPETPNFEEKRAIYTQSKNIREYVLNIGFLVRKPINEELSVYALASIGPMITDTETERMSKGFAFADVLAVGFCVKIRRTQFDIRPSLRHVSNAGLGSSNAGYNTKNLEFGVSYNL
ncbi:acyloxyacyl hydrolase [Flavobacterium reichenbachii]|uniref:Lipid A 3-O-deacylase n=1 Tax=Flavobacterium reichenbachii TaxID=362418 RepID=A0A085ZNZ0_9FLAO|nr:acyloxyacyl hydrolase [Flavobacterium reichenbachii]KFF06154.1 hypothetical protein IW19_11700 [Flavobacterium reichenbachii]OXB17624.1 hypothetical protein B0A68_04865 [Flavobacterium reichenbachii]